MTNLLRPALVVLALLGPMAIVGSAQEPTAPPDNPSPELVSQLTKELSITPEQATGGAGAIFGLAKTRLSPEQFGKVSESVPGMDGLLKAAPKPAAAPASAMGQLGSALPGAAGPLAALAGPFKSLGLSPEMAPKMIPILTKFVGARGGTDVGSVLAGALK